MVILSGKASWQGHVGFFKGQGAQKLNLLGGNQNDQVKVKADPASKLLGVRRAIAPRSNPSESTTLQASTVTALAGASATATAGVAAMHPAAQVMLICAGVLMMLAGAFVLAMLGAFLWGAAKQKSNQKIRDLKARVSAL